MEGRVCGLTTVLMMMTYDDGYNSTLLLHYCIILSYHFQVKRRKNRLVEIERRTQLTQCFVTEFINMSNQ